MFVDSVALLLTFLSLCPDEHLSSFLPFRDVRLDDCATDFPLAALLCSFPCRVLLGKLLAETPLQWSSRTSLGAHVLWSFGWAPSNRLYCRQMTSPRDSLGIVFLLSRLFDVVHHRPYFFCSFNVLLHSCCVSTYFSDWFGFFSFTTDGRAVETVSLPISVKVCCFLWILFIGRQNIILGLNIQTLNVMLGQSVACGRLGRCGVWHALCCSASMQCLCIHCRMDWHRLRRSCIADHGSRVLSVQVCLSRRSRCPPAK